MINKSFLLVACFALSSSLSYASEQVNTAQPATPAAPAFVLNFASKVKKQATVKACTTTCGDHAGHKHAGHDHAGHGHATGKETK